MCDEFLQLLSLFTQKIIAMRILVERGYFFLGTGELMVMFKELVGWNNPWNINEGYWGSGQGQFSVSM